MICVNKWIRVTQSINSKKIMGDFIVYNSKTGGELKINYSCYLLLKKINNMIINNDDELKLLAKRYSHNYKEIIKLLFDNNFICYTNIKEKNNNILEPLKLKFPLTYLALEITEKCNLKCKHCYGQYGSDKNCSQLTLEYIKSLKPTLDRLHTKSIALTGGEVLTHKDFEEIANFFLNNGFKLTIFTNGYNYIRLGKFLESTKDYSILMRVSLDGLNKTHNSIRRRDNAYENTIKSLELLSNYPNISSGISTVIMRENLDEVSEFDKTIMNQFPKFQHQYDLIFPIENEQQQKSAFSLDDFDDLYKKYPFIFTVPETKMGRTYRCTGGVTSAAIDASKYLRICSAATSDNFLLGNLNESSLYDVWKRPNCNGRRFRKEKALESSKCKKCSIRNKCNLVSCRLQAYHYTKDMNNPSPLTCFMERKMYNE